MWFFILIAIVVGVGAWILASASSSETFEIQSLGSQGWKNREQDWQIEYSDQALATDMDHVTGFKSDMPYADTNAKSSVNLQYYHNPIDFCKNNTNSHPCPNFWLTDSQFKGINGSFTHPSGDLSNPVPKLQEFQMKPILDLQKIKAL